MTLVVATAPNASQPFQTSKQIDGRDVHGQLLLKDCCKAPRASRVAITAVAQKQEAHQKVAQTLTLLVQLGTGSCYVQHTHNTAVS